MCKKLRYCNSQYDECLILEIIDLRAKGLITVASCCGHGKYPKTILIIAGSMIFDYFSYKIVQPYKLFGKWCYYRKVGNSNQYKPNWS